MPAKIDALVEKLLADPDFHSDKDEKERKSIAFAIANDRLDGSRQDPDHSDADGEGSNNFFSSRDEPSFSWIKGADGKNSKLVFKNAVLARAETNENRDEISVEGIRELADTIGGWPINVEHQELVNAGVFTAGREKSHALLVDGVIWADRYPDEAQAVVDGSMGLSIEAKASLAECSVCRKEFKSATSYCDHLTARKKHDAVRILSGLKAKGGALTKSPAGTDTSFNVNQIYFVASHAMDQEEDPAATVARLKQEKQRDILIKEAIVAEELKKVQEELSEALAKITELSASVGKKETTVEELQAKVSELESKQEKIFASERRAQIGEAITDEEWEDGKDDFTGMPQKMFDLFIAKINDKKSSIKNGKGESGDTLTLNTNADDKEIELTVV